MSFLFTSFNRRIMLVLCIALIPVTLLLLSSHIKRRNDRIQEMRDHLQSVSRLLARNQEIALNATTQLLKQLSTQEYIRTRNVAAANAEFKRILDESPRIANIGLATLDGKVIASVLPQPANANLPSRRWFTSAIETGKISAGEYRLGQASGKPVVVFGAPVFSETGSLVAVVFNSLIMSTIEDDLHETGLPASVRLTLISSDGNILIHYPWNKSDPEPIDSYQALLSELDGRTGGSSAVVSESNGDRRLFGYHRISNHIEPSNMFLALSISQDELTESVNRLFWRDVALMLLVLTGSLLMTWLICSKLLMRRIRRLISITRKLGEGDMQAQLPTEPEHDEIRELDDAFNTMVRRLRARDEEVHQKQAEILETKLQLLQAQKMELLGRLAGGLAHDLKNILMVVGGSAQIIEQDTPDEGIRRLARQITTASENAGMMIGHLLAFSRNQSVDTQEVDLNQIIEEGNSLVQHLVGRKVRIQTSLDPSVPKIVAAPSQITQVVLNLAINARDAMKDGGDLIIATASGRMDSVVPGKPYVPGVYLQVSDTGHGIEPAIIDRIFDPFFTTKPDTQGTGLGLSSVQTIVRTLGGSIEIASESGKGTSFKIFFPSSPMTD